MTRPAQHTTSSSSRKTLIVVSLLLSSVFLHGCVVWEFVEVRWQNSTGYFNTYYNAKTLYDEALEEVEQNTQPPLEASPSASSAISAPVGGSMKMVTAGSGGGVPMLTDGGMTSAGDVASGGDAAASGDMMQMSGDGDMGDLDGMDGMAPGGASLFGAPGGRRAELETRRKIMKEVGMSSSVVSKLGRVIEKGSRLLVSYPKSKWVDDALLMIGVSYFYKSEIIKAERKFNELLDGFPDSDLRPDAYMWMARVQDRIDNIDEAEQLFFKAIDEAIKFEKTDVIADAYYSLGEMYLTTNRQEKAVEAYTEGAQYTGSIAKRIKLELALAREHEHLGNLDKAQEAYGNIIKLDPELKLLFAAELNYARISRLRGDIDEAINTLADMLDEPGYIEFDGDLQLEIGHLYASADEIEAAVGQYTYVDTTFKQTPVPAKADYALAKLYEEKLLNYDKAYEYYTKSKLAYPGIPEATYSGIRAKAFEPYLKLRRKLNDLDTLLFYVLHPDSLAIRDSMQVILDSLDLEKRIAEGFDPNEKTEEQRLVERLAKRRPHGRNTGKVNPWRQELDLRTASKTPSPMVGNPTGQSTTTVAMNVPLYRKLPIRAVSADSVLQVLSVVRMEMGWVMFDRIVNLDSATFYYQFAIDGKLPDSLEAQAYYTLAEISRRQKNTELAAHFDDLLVREHYRSKYTAPILLSRGIELPKDSATVAREAYDRAAQILEQGDIEQGIRALRRMSESYSYSDQAARAQLAIAMTYENRLGDGERALKVYRNMVTHFPESQFTERARAILAALEAEKNAPPVIEKTELEPYQKPREVITPVIKKPLTPKERFELMRDSVLAGQKKLQDPTEDEDFPLGLPGDKKPEPKEETQPQPSVLPPKKEAAEPKKTVLPQSKPK
jgi:tetratricopeptide (TPR) repeat protein